MVDATVTVRRRDVRAVVELLPSQKRARTKESKEKRQSDGKEQVSEASGPCALSRRAQFVVPDQMRSVREKDCLSDANQLCVRPGSSGCDENRTARAAE